MRTSSLAIVISAVLATTAAYSQSADTSVLSSRRILSSKLPLCKEHRKRRCYTAIRQSREYS